MKTIANLSFNEERVLYNSDSIEVKNCKFDGPKYGENALKESKNIVVKDSYFNLRYPFWDDKIRKNPKSGYIKADHIKEIILENSVYNNKCKIVSKN